MMLQNKNGVTPTNITLISNHEKRAAATVGNGPI